MKKRMLINDFRKNKLVTLAACVFMAASACFIGLAVLLSGSLLASIDDLMAAAETCDFLQMHAGAIDEPALKRFAEREDCVEKMQVCTLLNIENGVVSLNGRSLSDNNQDNGLCVQSAKFDYLLGTDNSLLHAAPGEVYVPVCYKNEYGLAAGQSMEIGGDRLTIAGFLRDSQMNSMMASSKRFLVCGEDYERFRELGSEEYLIEFKLKPGADVDAFARAYTEAGLPNNGPTITAALIRMMNALSDGLMILVIFLAGAVVLIISLVCIRCIVLAGMEKDRREAGMLKAIGVSAKDRRRLYILKYLLLSAVGGAVGLAAAAGLAGPLGAQMRELYGTSGKAAPRALAALAGVVLAEAILLLSVRRSLKSSERISAVDALRGAAGTAKRRKGRLLPISAVMAASFLLMLVPLNLSSTISSDRFVTYMGIGNSQIRMDVRQSDRINDITGSLMEKLSADSRVRQFAVMQTKRFRAVLGDGTQADLLVELGNHEVFPLTYGAGEAPDEPGELALSNLNAADLGCGVGDTLTLRMDGAERAFTVCGIYSDITNGGKTAKAYGEAQTVLRENGDPVMWSVIYVTLSDGEPVDSWMDAYREEYGDEDSSVKIVDIAQYMDGVYGQTIERIRRAALVSIAAACLIIFVVVLLFLRLAIWQERSDISLRKALGIGSRTVRREYMRKACGYFAAGTAAGVILGVTVGERLAGALLSRLGATGFRFIVDYKTVLLAIPAAALAVAVLAARTGLGEIDRIGACECCMGRE